MPIMQLTAHTIALIMAALPASIMAWDCDKEQHQNVCPDYSIGPACFGTMSWGHCDRGCAESVHVADGTWCSGTGVILALGVPISTPGSQNHPAPPPVPYQPGAQPGAAPTSGTPTPGSQNPASSPVSSQPGAAPNPSVAFPTALSGYSMVGSNIAGVFAPPSAPAPPPPPPPATTPEKTPDPPEATDPNPDPPNSPVSTPTPAPPDTTPPPTTEEETKGCHRTKPDPRIKQTTLYALCL